jgi:hypothetical protein
VTYPRFADMAEAGDSIYLGRYLVSGADTASLYLKARPAAGAAETGADWRGLARIGADWRTKATPQRRRRRLHIDSGLGMAGRAADANSSLPFPTG